MQNNSEKYALQDLVAPDGVCFGCGAKNANGLQIKSYWDTDNVHVVMAHTPDTCFMGWPSLVYGGLISCLIDCHSNWTTIAYHYRAEGREPGTVPQIVTHSFSAFANVYNDPLNEKCTKEGAFKNGQCVQVDNYLLYVESFGMSVDPNIPNIIFFPGSGATLDTWNRIAPTVAKFAHVVLYNRSGYGPSQQYEKSKALTAPLVINNLILLLKKINVPPPYILVGHSHGGLFAQYFALTNPNMIKGMVMVDSSTN